MWESDDLHLGTMGKKSCKKPSALDWNFPLVSRIVRLKKKKKKFWLSRKPSPPDPRWCGCLPCSGMRSPERCVTHSLRVKPACEWHFWEAAALMRRAETVKHTSWLLFRSHVIAAALFHILRGCAVWVTPCTDVVSCQPASIRVGLRWDDWRRKWSARYSVSCVDPWGYGKSESV